MMKEYQMMKLYSIKYSSKNSEYNVKANIMIKMINYVDYLMNCLIIGLWIFCCCMKQSFLKSNSVGFMSLNAHVIIRSIKFFFIILSIWGYSCCCLYYLYYLSSYSYHYYYSSASYYSFFV